MFLKRKLLIIFLLSSLTIISKANKDENSPSIIIIGAGASGIAAASKLFQNGFKNVKILEAENRMGGRVFTTNFSDYLVDMGGQWVNGEDGNVAFDMAWPLGLLEKRNDTTRTNRLSDSSGKLIKESLSDDFFRFYEVTREDAQVSAKKQRNISTGEYFKTELDQFLNILPNWKENEKGLLHLLDMMEMASDAADTMYDVSISSAIEYQEIPGTYMINWKKRGYSTILDILMKRYPNPEEELPVMNNTILNTEVTSIDYTDKNGKVTVKTKNGETYSADHVIFTCSLGVLKDKHSSLFQPALPEEKQKTIKALGFGTVAKIYLSYEEPWWPNDTLDLSYFFLWNNEDLEMLKNDPEKSWLQGLVGFFSVEHKPRLFYGWVSGKHSREMEKLPEEKVFNQYIEVLQRFLGSSYNLTTPTGMKRTMWGSNDHFKGTYSFRSVQAEAENVFPATLAEPIGETKPVLLFAGEATNSKLYGEVHGAIETGWREADRLIKLYPNLGKN